MYLSGNPTMKVRCITNNPLAKEIYPECEFHEVSVVELFRIAKQLVEGGHALLSHPLYGNIRPDVGPYKSVVLELAVRPVDQFSLQQITSSIAYTEELCAMHAPLIWDEEARQDFKEVDISILTRILNH